MTARMKMKPAGSLLALFTTLACVGSGSGLLAQQAPRTSAVSTPAPAAPTVSTPSDPVSSVTVEQIVARQEDHFNKIRNAQGTAVHSETRYNEQGQPQQPVVQYIFFAYEGDKSVTLAMPKQAADFYKGAQGQIPWKHVTSAFHLAGDTVYALRKPDGTSSAPTVMAVPFNPAVHENNPLVAFHPRQISDEQLPLRDLARAIPNMPQRPQVYDVKRDGKSLLRVDFINPKVPTERLYYVIDPARGYLPVEIARMSNNRPVSISRIVVGNTPDGTWIPARRERVIYGASGKQASRQTWHYEYFAINQKLAPKTLSLMYFNLPLNTPITVITDGTATASAPQKQQGAPAATPVRPSPPAQQQLAPAATPIAPRIAPAPVRVPL